MPLKALHDNTHGVAFQTAHIERKTEAFPREKIPPALNMLFLRRVPD